MSDEIRNQITDLPVQQTDVWCIHGAEVKLADGRHARWAFGHRPGPGHLCEKSRLRARELLGRHVDKLLAGAEPRNL